MFELKIYPVLGLVFGVNYYEQELENSTNTLAVLQLFIFLIQVDILWEKENKITDGI